jgi:uncharacterized damage-inducible protein DinB
VNKQLHKTFLQLEHQREQFLARITGLSATQFSASPAPGQWSVSQIVTHLIASERLSIAYMKKKSLGIDQLGNSGMGSSLRMILLKISQRFPFKFKAPKVVIDNTPDAWPFDELVHQWQSVRNELSAFLESLDDKHIKKLIYKHPIAGRLDARQAMIFFYEHANHHRPQIERILRMHKK